MLGSLWSALILALLVSTHLSTEPAWAAATAKPDNIRLTWSENPRTTQTIGWRTDTTVIAGKVQYARVGQPFTTVAAPPPERLATNAGAIHLFSITLRDLQPGSRYQYRVGDRTNWSAYYAFETEEEPTNEFKFLVFGDSHAKKADYSIVHSIMSLPMPLPARP